MPPTQLLDAAPTPFDRVDPALPAVRSTAPPLVAGHRVVVRELGESPDDALSRCLFIEEQPLPDLSTLGPRDVLVAVRSAQVGWVDVIMSSGQYQHVPTPPYCPGLESAGTVAWVGAEAARTLSVGDPVLVDGFSVGPRASGPYQRWGGFATWAVAPVEALLPIPHGLSFDEAACLLGSYETAWHCLVARGRLQAGETVLIHGASGATGLAAVEVARNLGATVIATGRSEDKLQTVRARGATHTVCLTTPDGSPRSLRDEIKALTGGRGVDVVYDGVGGDLTVESLRCLRFGGRLLIVGWAATPHVSRGKGQRGAPNANQLPTNLVMMKGLDVLGCPTVIATVNDPTIRAPRLAQLLDWAATGAIRPHVSRRFQLTQVLDGLRAKWTGAVTGGCVLHPWAG
jgi:NADPH2:quinone reductase